MTITTVPDASAAGTSTARPVDRRTLTRWLVHHTRPLLPPLVGSVAARVVGDLLDVLFLVVAAHALLEVGTGGSPSWWNTLLTLLLVAVAKAGLRYAEHFSGHWVAFSALHQLRSLLFARLVPQAPAATVGRASAELTERALRDIDRIEVFFAHTIPPVIASVLVPSVALTWFGLTHGGVPAAVVAVPLALAVALPFLAARRSWQAARNELSARGDLATHVTDDVQGLREVLTLQAAPRRTEARRRVEAQVNAASQSTARTVAVRHVIERGLWGVALVGLLLVCDPTGQAAATDQATTLVVGVAVLLGLWLGSTEADDFATGLDAAFAACARVHAVVEAPPQVSDLGVQQLASAPAREIRLRQVGFGYPNRASGEAGAQVLDGVDFVVPAGGWHHLVGTSGCGKSTVAQLLVRSYDPQWGSVQIDGLDAREIPLDDLRRAVMVVDQRPVLFAGSVAENVRLAVPEASDAEVLAALTTAGLDPSELDGGLDASVGERGSALSGGQVQRVALARALVARPQVLVLDEALSQLDEAGARTIRSRIAALPERPTVLEVTHRVDLIDAGGAVTVLDAGQVVQQGNARDLRATDGPFARLLDRVGEGTLDAAE